MPSIFHTRVAAALADGSTWAAIAAGITAASVLAEPFNYLVSFSAVLGVVLKGGGDTAKKDI